MGPPEVINADAVVLRRWRSEFADEAAAAVRVSLNELMPFMPWATPAYDRAAAAAFVEQSDVSWADGSNWNYAIFSADGVLVGSIGLHDRVGPDAVEIGYWLHRNHTGKGYATMAVLALTQAALRLPGVERVVIKHDAANTASGAVPARAGFREVSRQPDEITAPGEVGIEVTWEYP